MESPRPSVYSNDPFAKPPFSFQFLISYSLFYSLFFFTFLKGQCHSILAKLQHTKRRPKNMFCEKIFITGHTRYLIARLCITSTWPFDIPLRKTHKIFADRSISLIG